MSTRIRIIPVQPWTAAAAPGSIIRDATPYTGIRRWSQINENLRRSSIGQAWDIFVVSNAPASHDLRSNSNNFPVVSTAENIQSARARAWMGVQFMTPGGDTTSSHQNIAFTGRNTIRHIYIYPTAVSTAIQGNVFEIPGTAEAVTDPGIGLSEKDARTQMPHTIWPTEYTPGGFYDRGEKKTLLIKQIRAEWIRANWPTLGTLLRQRPFYLIIGKYIAFARINGVACRPRRMSATTFDLTMTIRTV